MALRWLDIEDIAIALEEAHPGVDILQTRFTNLRQWVLDLDGFDDPDNESNEKILEAIQMAWLDERD